jgi:hypothetical protein
MVIPHLTDDDLVLHYYGEMSPAEDAAAAAHLAHCAACRGELTKLQRVLGVVDGAALAVDPPEGFERTVWARLEPSLRRDERRGYAWLALTPAPLALAAAVLVLVGASFLAGRMFQAPPTGGSRDAAAPVSAAQVRERILLVDLGDHLDRSQMVLVELVSADTDGALDISAERARAEQLVADNRIYRRTAAETGERAVSDLLDELERVLVDVAASPERLTSDQLDEVRRRIESRGLLFKVRVVSSEVRERQRERIVNAGI